MREKFFSDCGGPYDLTPAHTISNWESMPTSEAELAIMQFLRSAPHRYHGKRLLHIGIGNCSLPREFSAGLDQYVGITISVPEILRFESEFAQVQNAAALLMNKYDPRMYSRIHGDFDIIIDNVLKSYACCTKHFEQMMEFFASKLRKTGRLITTKSGVLWGWQGNTKRAYTPGAQTDPSIAKSRILGCVGLRRQGERLGLIMTCERVPHCPMKLDDRILMLTKK